MDKKDKLEEFIIDQIKSIEINEEDRMWKDYEKKIGLPKSHFPSILWPALLLGVMVASYWIFNNYLITSSQNKVQHIKTQSALNESLLIEKERNENFQNSTLDLSIKDKSIIYEESNSENPNENNNTLDEFIPSENKKISKAIAQTMKKVGLTKVVDKSPSIEKVEKTEKFDRIDMVEPIRQINERKIRAKVDTINRFKKVEDIKAGNSDSVMNAINVAKKENRIEAVDEPEKLNVLSDEVSIVKKEEIQSTLRNSLIKDKASTNETYTEFIENNNKELTNKSTIEQIKRIEFKKLSVAENHLLPISNTNLECYTKAHKFNPWFVEYQLLRSFNGIRQQSFGLGKSIYKKSNLGLDIIAGLQYDTGYSLSMDSAIIIRAISITSYIKYTDLNYLIDGFIAGLYTYDYQNIQFAAGAKISYGIFNEYHISEYNGIVGREHFSHSASSRSNRGLQEINNWRAINKLRFNAILRSGYSWKHFLVGLTASKQINSLIKNNLAASNKSNTPVQLGFHFRFDF